MGEASLRQMFVNSHAFIHAHQWVLVVLGLSLSPPSLIKKPNTTRYLHHLHLFWEENFLPDSNGTSFYAYVYLHSISFGSNSPSYTLLGKIRLCRSILARNPAARMRTSMSGEIKEQIGVFRKMT